MAVQRKWDGHDAAAKVLGVKRAEMNLSELSDEQLAALEAAGLKITEIPVVISCGVVPALKVIKVAK